MFEARWFVIVAAILLAFLTVDNANAKRPVEQGNAQQSVATSVNRVEAINVKVAKRAGRSEKEEQSCGSGRYGSNADLCAQWKAADAAANSAWWAWLGGIVGFGSLLGVFVALGLAFHSNWIARDTAKRQLRAYCGMLGIDGSHVTPGDTPQFVVTVANTGQTPARRLRIDTTCWIAPAGQIGYAADVSGYAEVTVGSGKTISSRAVLGHQLTQDNWESLLAGAIILCLGIYGEYEDVFGATQSFYTVSYGEGFNGQFTMKPSPGQDRCT